MPETYVRETLGSVTDPTPYDDERRRYSREALARLVLSDRAVGLSEAAGGLAVTRYDSYCGPGGRVSEALRLTQHAEGLLAGAVVYERERGSSWEDMAQYLGVEAEAVRERFSPDLEKWNTAFDVPPRVSRPSAYAVTSTPSRSPRTRIMEPTETARWLRHSASRPSSQPCATSPSTARTTPTTRSRAA